MPAQATVTWVQCNNPKCLKWRKIPFHVDMDLLLNKFFCKDNVWDPTTNSCDAPQDTFDNQVNTILDKDGIKVFSHSKYEQDYQLSLCQIPDIMRKVSLSLHAC